MVTGHRAFHGETSMATLASVINQEPKPVSEAAPAVPRDLEKLIARCMRKDPTRRAQHIADIKLGLEEIREESESGSLSVATTAKVYVIPSLGGQERKIATSCSSRTSTNPCHSSGAGFSLRLFTVPGKSSVSVVVSLSTPALQPLAHEDRSSPSLTAGYRPRPQLSPSASDCDS